MYTEREGWKRMGDSKIRWKIPVEKTSQNLFHFHSLPRWSKSSDESAKSASPWSSSRTTRTTRKWWVTSGWVDHTFLSSLTAPCCPQGEPALGSRNQWWWSHDFRFLSTSVVVPYLQSWCSTTIGPSQSEVLSPMKGNSCFKGIHEIAHLFPINVSFTLFSYQRKMFSNLVKLTRIELAVLLFGFVFLCFCWRVSFQ